MPNSLSNGLCRNPSSIKISISVTTFVAQWEDAPFFSPSTRLFTLVSTILTNSHRVNLKKEDGHAVVTNVGRGVRDYMGA